MPDPYSQLLEWRRSETAGRGLAKLPKEFYESTRRYLADTRAIFEAELREDPSSRKGEVARQTYQRAQATARDLVEARMTKVLSQAFQAAVGGSRDLPNALGEERELFDTLVAALHDHRAQVAPYLETGSAKPTSRADPAPTSGPPADPTPAGTPGAGLTYVRILKDHRPMAVGAETLELRREDVLSLSEETARILVSAGIAERLKTGPARPVT